MRGGIALVSRCTLDSRTRRYQLSPCGAGLAGTTMMARALSVIGGKLKLMHYCSARLFLREMREDRVCEEVPLTISQTQVMVPLGSS
jgi:hypothetical protein